MTMPVAAEKSSECLARPEVSRKPVARCLFGRSDPEDLDRMSKEATDKERKRVMEKYGVDLEELGRRDDIDVLIVPIPPQQTGEPHDATSPDDVHPDTNDLEPINSQIDGSTEVMPQDLSMAPKCDPPN